ncbi:hypothetical protein [Micromonospora aurantiaca (nom. illeg.)]|uniref:hypothetical protein n=1 Tax=Micromonospora aurantiaca (nom. illeg.) TaxID=47850 RepID=UPI0001BF570F|nr:hypothetical protein [Micromonospora aurantiaca]ADL47610.1 hypothetical protein Micau_4094 [Micromonospora aurantiaca ATCC 27029]
MTHPHLPARRRCAALLGAALILLTACQPADTATAGPDASPPASSPPAAAPAPAATAAGLTAQQRLNLIADTISTAPADTTDGLPYTYLHLQCWARASTTIVRTDVRRWRLDADGSGRETIRRAPDLRGLDHQPTPGDRQELSRATPHTVQHGIGQLHPYLPGDIPADPRELTRLLAPPALAGEPAYPRILTSGIVGLAASQHLDPRQRATTLRVLAAVAHLTYQGTTTDLAGRTGLAFQVVADGSTSTLLIDPATGDLLAATEWINGGRRPGLHSSTLVLEHGRTRSTGSSVSSSTAAAVTRPR